MKKQVASEDVALGRQLLADQLASVQNVSQGEVGGVQLLYKATLGRVIHMIDYN